MAWDEWEQLKAEAAANSGGGPSPDGVASGDVTSRRKVWATAGERLKRLDEPIGKALTRLGDSQTGLDVSGVRSAAAQRALYDSWKSYVGQVSKRCGDLGVLLENAGHTLSKSDEQLRGELERIGSQYQDTAAVGGQKTVK